MAATVFRQPRPAAFFPLELLVHRIPQSVEQTVQMDTLVLTRQDCCGLARRCLGMHLPCLAKRRHDSSSFEEEPV